MSNSPEQLRALNKRCFGKGGVCSRPAGGRQAECIGRAATHAATFQEELCRTISTWIRNQTRADHHLKPGECVTIVHLDALTIAGDEEVTMVTNIGFAMQVESKAERCIDDLTGLPLPKELCQQARKLELDDDCNKEGGLGDTTMQGSTSKNGTWAHFG